MDRERVKLTIIPTRHPQLEHLMNQTLLMDREGETNHNTDPPHTAGTSHEADPPDGQREGETNPTAGPAPAAGTPIAAANLSEGPQPEDTREDSHEKFIPKDLGVSMNPGDITEDTRLLPTEPDIDLEQRRT
ncbi:hypothetical protein ACOMHN_041734 [Nucella lapillus]